MNRYYPYTQESTLQQALNLEIAQLWSTRTEGTYHSFDKKPIYWCSLQHPNHQKAIVLVNGRIESSAKYQELCYDLFQQGFDVYTYDHRGQGLSPRLTSDRQIGYVEQFEDYVTDLQGLVELFQLERYTQRLLFGHSMGGAVATRYIQTHPSHPFDAVALSAPMFGIAMPWYLRPFAFIFSQIMATITTQPSYAAGYGPYYAKPFASNLLTHSQIRYQWFRDLYQEHPELQLGGPSYHWVWQSLIACKQCLQLTRQINIPLLILQAGEEAIVSNQAQNRLFKKLLRTQPHARLCHIAGARHELLFEQDRYRKQALDHMLRFFADPTAPSQN
ncbi:alpha/beta fold hydrolase [Vibrio sp. dsl-7]|uniref:Alpha/beta fold hydrolase n=1 Tax=Vibrio chanodichtyis TaxID=3027932 RepID=A0ABT5V399_9VIBR|nr:alpha/beta fold hydrolase [Vibrio chanodichtyis]MDE1515597.1 alpha/beta fold hydrolase [Vibrio chanodichtyis]